MAEASLIYIRHNNLHHSTRRHIEQFTVSYIWYYISICTSIYYLAIGLLLSLWEPQVSEYFGSPKIVFIHKSCDVFAQKIGRW